MLILVGVTVNFAIGNDGIILKTKEAKFKAEVTQIKDLVDIERETELALRNANGKENMTFDENERNGLMSTVPESLKSEYRDIIIAWDGKLYYTGTNEKIAQWCRDIGIGTEIPIDKAHEYYEEGDYIKCAKHSTEQYQIGESYTYSTDTNKDFYRISSSALGFDIILQEEGGYYDPEGLWNLQNTIQNVDKKDLNWVVLGIDSNDNSKLLITSDAPTEETIMMCYYGAYTRGKNILNSACAALYSNNSLGVTARSMTMQDVANCLNQPSLTNTVKLNTVANWNDIASAARDALDEGIEIFPGCYDEPYDSYDDNKLIEILGEYDAYNIADLIDIEDLTEISPARRNLIDLGSTCYYLADEGVIVVDDEAYFGIGLMMEGQPMGASLHYSTKGNDMMTENFGDEEYSAIPVAFGFRPVVSLSPSVD